jgi:PhnB protein
MPQLNAYISFDGNCAEAMQFYETVLEGKLEAMMKNSQSPMAGQLPPGSADLVMHARLVLDNGVLMAGDAMPGCSAYEGMKGFSLTLTYPDATQARDVFARLSEGGKVTMAMEASFWADAFGMLVDRYGTPWIINGGMKPF